MSVIQPNDKQTILVEDFITLAKAHLLTIQGQAITQTTYSTAAGAILPGSCFWNGYSVIDTPQPPDQDFPNLPKVSTKFITECFSSKDGPKFHSPDTPSVSILLIRF